MDILNAEQKTILFLLSQSPLAEFFYWTGGTLLAHQYLHHRLSFDLDFFSEKPFTFEMVNEFMGGVKKHLALPPIQSQKIFDRWEFLCEGKTNVRVDFVHYNGEKKTLVPRKRRDGVFIDSFEDIAANKVMAYVDRNEPKDLFDLYYILHKNGITPKKLLVWVEKKFGVAFSESMLWSESFKGAKRLSELIPYLIISNEQEKQKVLDDIRSYFIEQSNRFLSRTLE